MKEDLLNRMVLQSEVGQTVMNDVVLKARYTKYLVEFKKGKEFKIAQILVNTENEAKDVIAALDKGGNFSTLAKEKSIAPSKDNGGEEGYIPVDMLLPDIKNKVIYLKVGEYTKEAVKIDNGFCVFSVLDIRESSPQKYEEAVPMLRRTIMQEEAAKLLGRLKKGHKIERFNEDGSPAPEPAAVGPQ
jgi:peptidyl-prolyl cis-trans isomerase C